MIARPEEVVNKDVMGSTSFENIVCWYDLDVEISEDRRWPNRPLNGVFLLKILDVTKSYISCFS